MRPLHPLGYACVMIIDELWWMCRGWRCWLGSRYECHKYSQLRTN